ncbi:MAG: hypothetical protein Q9169_003514 [Polycauliona sp. 2 TL-2023]
MSEPEVQISYSPSISAIVFSETLPRTEVASLNSVQLHELAILREQGYPGPWHFELITEYFNREYEREWTPWQIVAVWRKLRQEFEKHDEINPGHVLLTWHGDFESTSEPGRDVGRIPLLRAILEQTMARFFAVMESEIDNSSIGLNMELERKADDRVTVLTTSVEEGFAKQARDKKWTKHELAIWGPGSGIGKFFINHPKGNWTSNQQTAVHLWRKEIKKAFQADLLAWRHKFAGGEPLEIESAPTPEKRDYKIEAYAEFKKLYPEKLEDLDNSKAVGDLRPLKEYLDSI